MRPLAVVPDREAAAACAQCGKSMEVNSRGRPRRYCSAQCKSRSASEVRASRRAALRASEAAIEAAGLSQPLDADRARRLADRLDESVDTLDGLLRSIDPGAATVLLRERETPNHGLKPYELLRAGEVRAARSLRLIAQMESTGVPQRNDARLSELRRNVESMWDVTAEIALAMGVTKARQPKMIEHEVDPWADYHMD